LEEEPMKAWNLILSILVVLPTFAAGQSAPSAAGNPPQIAFDITKADIDTLLKNPDRDQPLRVVDMGKYNLEVAIIHRDPTNDKPGDPITVAYHDQTAETYIMLSGSAILTTGGTITDKKVRPGYNIVNGPGGDGLAGKDAYSRKVHAGDVVIIPPGVAHGWSQITEELVYLSVRPDPDRALPAGYVSPLLLKNLPPDAK
jgi:mannose-6-phosphate isomerase-like protein (cupin superfamily)